MGGLFDTDSIRDLNPPEKVFSLLGIRYVRKGDKLKADCPGCGKSNKFDYNTAKDVFNCFSCSFGVGQRGVIDLVMAVLGRDFIGACQYLGGAKTLTESEKRQARDKRREWEARAKREAANKLRRTKKQMEDILAGCQPGEGTLAEIYLRTRGHGRGIEALGWSPDILFHPGLEAYVGEGKDAKCVGIFPAMVAKGREKGKLVLLHRTYLAPIDGDGDNGIGKAYPTLPPEFDSDDWNPKQMKGVLTRCRDGVYLGATDGVTDNPNEPIITAEGIESTYALATAGVTGAFYANLSLNRIVGQVDDTGQHINGWAPPEPGRPIIIACDNDLSPTPNQFPDYEIIRDKKVNLDRARAEFRKAGDRLISLGFNTGLWFPPAGCDPEDALFYDEPEPVPAKPKPAPDSDTDGAAEPLPSDPIEPELETV